MCDQRLYEYSEYFGSDIFNFSFQWDFQPRSIEYSTDHDRSLEVVVRNVAGSGFLRLIVKTSGIEYTLKCRINSV